MSTETHRRQFPKFAAERPTAAGWPEPTFDGDMPAALAVLTCPHGTTHLGGGYFGGGVTSKLLKSSASETLSRQESMSAGTLASADSQGHTGHDHGEVRQLRDLCHAGVGGAIISGLSGHRRTDDCRNRTVREKLKTVAPAVVLDPPRMTAPNVTLSAFPAGVSPPRSWIQNPNVYSFVL